MAMSKKDYEAIAAIMRESNLDLNDIENDLADYMAEDDPRFDRARFLAACRGEDSKDSAGRTVRYGR